MKTIRQGKCSGCQIAFTWKAGRMRVSDARCPKCGGKLVRTSYQFSGQWYSLDGYAVDMNGQRLAIFVKGIN
jgi:DNA-directed RNA polymerase subunit RPC12/RpoP